MSVVVDASALLAFIFREPGGETALHRSRGALLSTVNLFEVTAKARCYKGLTPESVLYQLLRLGVEIVPFAQSQAIIAAGLPERHGKKGLSMADRSCLALALDGGHTIVTADRVWTELDLGIEIELIR